MKWPIAKLLVHPVQPLLRCFTVTLFFCFSLFYFLSMLWPFQCSLCLSQTHGGFALMCSVVFLLLGLIFVFAMYLFLLPFSRTHLLVCLEYMHFYFQEALLQVGWGWKCNSLDIQPYCMSLRLFMALVFAVWSGLVTCSPQLIRLF